MRKGSAKPGTYSTFMPAFEIWSAFASGTFSMTIAEPLVTAVVLEVLSRRMFHSILSLLAGFVPL